jgi:hypothetical protein
MAPVHAAVARITAIGPDTLIAGGTLVIEGAQLAGDAPVRVTVAEVEVLVRTRSATRIELALPVGVFPCAAATAQPVHVTVGTVSTSITRVLRSAIPVSLEPGQSVSLLEPGQSRCVELAPAANGATARYVIAVVNTSATPGDLSNFELRSVGATPGGAANGAAPLPFGQAGVLGNTTLVLPRLPVSPRFAAAQRELENLPEIEAAHGALLANQLKRARAGGSAAAAWQSARSRAAFVGPGEAAAASRTTRVGDTLSFTAAHASCSTGRTVRARVVYIGSRALVLEDIAAPRAGSMDQQYRQLGGEFDSVVYPLLTKNIGDPLAMNTRLGGDGRVTMLFTRYVNDSLPGTAAFVSACNFYPRSTFAASNQDEVFYARVAGTWETPEEWRRVIRSTVVHEAKHLASFAERLSRGVDFEEPWLEEATARIAEELYARTFPGGGSWKGNVGFASSVGCELQQCDDRPLIMWKHFSGLHGFLKEVDVMSPLGGGAAAGTMAAYASGWALVRWATDRFAVDEAAWFKALVRGDAGLGIRGLARAAGQSEQGLLAEWSSALARDYSGTPIGAAATGMPSWRVADIMRDMARFFPGIFAAQPLKITNRVGGEFTVVQGGLPGGSTHFVSFSPESSSAQLLALSAAAGSPTRLAIVRVH